MRSFDSIVNCKTHCIDMSSSPSSTPSDGSDALTDSDSLLQHTPLLATAKPATKAGTTMAAPPTAATTTTPPSFTTHSVWVRRGDGHGGLRLSTTTTAVTPTSKPKRVRFLCGGAITIAPFTASFFSCVTWSLILLPGLIFFTTVAPRAWSRLHPAVVIVSALGALLTTALLANTAFRNPGFLPPGLRPPAVAAALQRVGPRPPTQEAADSVEGAGSQAEAEAEATIDGLWVPSQLNVADADDDAEAAYTWRYCDTCDVYRSRLVFHCTVCKHCVFECDHHCAWVGTCITRRTLATFYGFQYVGGLTALLLMATSLIVAIQGTLQALDMSVKQWLVAHAPLAWTFLVCMLLLSMLAFWRALVAMCLRGAVVVVMIVCSAVAAWPGGWQSLGSVIVVALTFPVTVLECAVCTMHATQVFKARLRRCCRSCCRSLSGNNRTQ